ncbi:hypothetical protein CABS01_00272 [Colletotrichum abscissum]|uniref:Uncharacterized protein n=1 Tax=Colletotrichum abscissum TaxID=1671311 RepID=A0A9P9X965_9PEZI|nr:uncharacterized protein CABS01_00272 [Colletotrichum abscissum]KAI3544153.1 hypothetical protein CABS02_09827 [Colletotrichum abscissum]KAK1525183.1 hypothetical protein CABS01_00272 [Colletotrichum abscissum]
MSLGGERAVTDCADEGCRQSRRHMSNALHAPAAHSPARRLPARERASAANVKDVKEVMDPESELVPYTPRGLLVALHVHQ